MVTQSIQFQHAAPVARIVYIMVFIGLIIMGLACAFMAFLAMTFVLPTDIGAALAEKASTSDNVPSTGRIGFVTMGGAAIAGAYFYVLWVLRKVVKTLLDGDPFAEDNINRLRTIWVVIACAEIFRMCVTMFSGIAVNNGAIEPTSSTLGIRFGTWFLVFVIATLAEVFRHGAELRRDAELTI